MDALETMWLLKQFVFPTLARADLDSLAAAHVLLASCSRPQRMRMLDMRVLVVPQPISVYAIRDYAMNLRAMQIAHGMAGLRYG